MESHCKRLAHTLVVAEKSLSPEAADRGEPKVYVIHPGSWEYKSQSEGMALTVQPQESGKEKNFLLPLPVIVLRPSGVGWGPPHCSFFLRLTCFWSRKAVLEELCVSTRVLAALHHVAYFQGRSNGALHCLCYYTQIESTVANSLSSSGVEIVFSLHPYGHLMSSRI